MLNAANADYTNDRPVTWHNQELALLGCELTVGLILRNRLSSLFPRYFSCRDEYSHVVRVAQEVDQVLA
jgi:hypothetical protein